MATQVGDEQLHELARRVGHQFQDPNLLHRALAHRSWCAETSGESSNERLEFLGDAVLGWAVADIGYRRFAEFSEGMLTDLRKSVVNAAALAEVADELGLGEFILLGKGESAAGGASKQSILSDVFEAVLGAVYVDAGADAAYAMVERLVEPRMANSIDQLDELDNKTLLQELCAQAGLPTPIYEHSSTGPDHAKTFAVTVSVDDRVRGRGIGRSKKAAEQVAATEACASFS